MQSKRGELVPIGEAFSGLDAGPLQAIRDATPQAGVTERFLSASPHNMNDNILYHALTD